MSNSYRAVIEGKSRDVIGFNEQGQLVLADGQHYIFEPFQKPAFDFMNGKLELVETLIVKMGVWIIGGDLLKNCEKGKSSNPNTRHIPKRRDLYNFLNGPSSPFPEYAEIPSIVDVCNPAHYRPAPGELLPPGVGGGNRFYTDPRLAVCAVAWFKHDDGADGWNTPVLLKSFRPLPPHVNTKVAAELEETKEKLRKAEEVAGDTLQEALSKWMRFDPPGMSADTKARIEKAVKIYATADGKHSLAKVATEFNVSRKTVSGWFKRFSEETGFPVVTHYRHESVGRHLQSIDKERLPANPCKTVQNGI